MLPSLLWKRRKCEVEVLQKSTLTKITVFFKKQPIGICSFTNIWVWNTFIDIFMLVFKDMLSRQSKDKHTSCLKHGLLLYLLLTFHFVIWLFASSLIARQSIKNKTLYLPARDIRGEVNAVLWFFSTFE